MGNGWGHPHRPSEAQAARAELAHELDVALHGKATFDGPCTEVRWGRLLEEVRSMARPVSAAIAEARRARADGAAMRAGTSSEMLAQDGRP